MIVPRIKQKIWVGGIVIITLFSFTNKIIYAETIVQTQQLTIQGNVTDVKGDFLPGVTVTIKGTSVATLTDKNGHYSIILPSQSKILIFSFVGMQTQEVIIGNQTNINITLLTTTIGLTEVVVIGYGTQQRGNITGAIGRVSGEILENQAVRDVGQALQGQIAGVDVTQASGNPSAGVNITIRGLGTFGANASPLIVIDGIITNYGLQDINPEDVDNISVLKDASASAIYGSRGANGVVLVTTKRGKMGKDIKPEINLSYYFGVDQVTRKIPVVNATQFATITNEYYTNGGNAAPFADPSVYGKGTNWQDEIFRTAMKQNVNLSFKGGSEKSAYSIGLGVAHAEGVVINSKNDKYNLSINNDLIPFKGLKISNTFLGSYSAENEGNSEIAVGTALQYAPTIPAYNPDGSFGIASHLGEPITINAPLVEALVPVNSYDYLRVLDNFVIEYEIIHGLKFKVEGGLEYFQNDVKNFMPTYDYGLGNQVVTASLNKNINYTINPQINYLLTFNKIIGGHSFDVLAGYTFQSSRNEYLNGYRENFINNDPNLQVLNAGTENDQARGNITEWDLQSYIGRLNYSYKNKYLLTATLRIDQSSRFIPSKRTGYFPSFSAGWILSDEPFMKNIAALSYLKIRAGYGQLGNQDIGIYPYQLTVSPGLDYVFGIAQNVASGNAPTSFVNQNISWESTSTAGLGTDANFFHNKLHFIIDYYNRHTSNILLQVPIQGITGNSLNPAYQNAGDVINKGYEFTVSYGNMDDKNKFTYNLAFNFTSNHNEVTRLENDASLIYDYSRTVQGQPINSFYGYVMEGIFQNQAEINSSPTQPNAKPGDIKFKDLNGDGVIDDNDRTFIGSSLFDKTFGLNGQVGYKNFDLSFTIVSKLGAKGETRDKGFDINRAGEMNAAIFLQTWTGEGTSNNFPRLVAGDPNVNERPSTFYLASLDYVRLKNVQLGYNIRLKGNTPLRKCRVYIACENLLTFTKWPGFDPELAALTSVYPLYRTIYVGINIGI